MLREYTQALFTRACTGDKSVVAPDNNGRFVAGKRQNLLPALLDFDADVSF
jgi:hypothetical protein